MRAGWTLEPLVVLEGVLIHIDPLRRCSANKLTANDLLLDYCSMQPARFHRTADCLVPCWRL